MYYENDYLEHRYHKYIKRYWVDGKWRYVYADRGAHQMLESHGADYRHYSKLANSATASYKRQNEYKNKARTAQNNFIHEMNKRTVKSITKKEIEHGKNYLSNLLKRIGKRMS